MPGRNGQVSRIYAVLAILEGAPHGLTVADLTSRLNDRGHEASKRTVYRDLEALSDAGFALSPTGDTGDSNATRWVLERLTKISEHFVLSPKELLSLYIARGVLAPLKETPFFSDLDGVFKKIELRIGTKGSEYLQDLSQEFQFQSGPRWGLGLDPELLETVRACCNEKQILSATYQSTSSGNTRQRKLGPHYLYFAQGSLYLVAEDLEVGKTKVFALPRMTAAQMLDEPYNGKVSDPQEFFNGSFGVFQGDRPLKVTILFSRPVAPYVKERQWHDSQQVSERPDGSVSLTLKVGITPEFVQWVLGFGPNAIVVEPDSLKDKISTAAALTASLYPKRQAA